MLALLFVAVLAGAGLQSATGFGFSLLSAPVLYAVLEPAPALGLLAGLGMTVNLMTLATEGRRPRPLVGEVVVLVAAALPGSLVGIVLLRSLDSTALQVLVSVGVVSTLVVRHQLTRRSKVVPVLADGPRPRPAWSAPTAGFLAGALGSSTSMSGPPLLLHLLGRGARPSVVRDTLTACFVVLGFVTPLALLVTRTTEAVPEGRQVAVLVPAVVVGHLLGRRGFARLAHSSHYELVVTIVLLGSVAAGLVGVIL